MSEAIELYNNATFTVVTDDQHPDQSEIWATQKEMAKAFGVTPQNIVMHIKAILQSGELQDVAVCKDFLHTASDGKHVPKWNKLIFSVYELLPNLAKTSKNGGGHVENHIKWSIIYIVQHGVG